MNKSKQAMFESLLIPVKTRLPPYQKGKVLLKLESGEHSIMAIPDFLALQKRLSTDFYKDLKPFESICTSNFVTHWMRLY